MASEAKPRPGYKLVFLVGYPRSGTTWLTLLLAHHPAVTATLHAGLFHALQPLRDWWQTPRPHGKRVLRVDPTAPDGLARADLTRLLAEPDLTRHLRALADRVFDAVACQSPQTSVVVEKTPENLEFLDWILDVMPDAYVLHVIRDPRSTYASIRRSLADWALPGAFSPGLVENTTGWCDYMQQGRAIEERIGDRYRPVFYEQLLADGVPILRQLYQWLGLEADEAFCRQAFTATGIDKLRAQNVMPAGFFHSGRADSWRADLSTADVKSIEYLAGDVMAQMGYERQFPTSGRPPFALTWRNTLGRAGRFVRYRLWENKVLRRWKRRWRLFLK